MATIQIRNVPEEVHRKYRERAAAAGMSLQEYLRAELVRNAALKTPDEVVREVARRFEVSGRPPGPKRSSADIVRRDRESH